MSTDQPLDTSSVVSRNPDVLGGAPVFSGMRVLLDENVPERLRHAFSSDFVVETVSYRGWKGIENGGTASEGGTHFDAPVTVDAGIPHQQSVVTYRIGVVVLRAGGTTLSDLNPLIGSLETELRQSNPGTVRTVSA